MVEEIVLWVIEIIGVIAFAVSGAMRGVLKQLDIIGVVLLALITSFGGGVIRDLMLGMIPPHLFVDSRYFILEGIAVIIGFACFIYAYVRKRRNELNVVTKSMVLNLADAVGLGIFCVNGASLAIEAGYCDNFMLVLFVGCISGVGGGILRDILVGEIPIIFRKYIYLLPTIVGTIAFYLINLTGLTLLAYVVGIVLIISIRIIAIVFKLNLPSIKIQD